MDSFAVLQDTNLAQRESLAQSAREAEALRQSHARALRGLTSDHEEAARILRGAALAARSQLESSKLRCARAEEDLRRERERSRRADIARLRASSQDLPPRADAPARLAALYDDLISGEAAVPAAQRRSFARAARRLAAAGSSDENRAPEASSVTSGVEKVDKDAATGIGPLGVEPLRFAERVSAFAIEGNGGALAEEMRRAGVRSLSQDCSALRGSLLPLHRAVSGFHFHGNLRLLLSTLRTLLDFRADPREVDHWGNTVTAKVLQTCAGRALLPALTLLLGAGAPADRPNAEGDAPLHIEMKRLRRDSARVVEILIEKGADVNRPDGRGQTPWQIFLKAVRSGRVPPYAARMLKVLLEAGVRVNSEAARAAAKAVGGSVEDLGLAEA